MHTSKGASCEDTAGFMIDMNTQSTPTEGSNNWTDTGERLTLREPDEGLYGGADGGLNTGQIGNQKESLEDANDDPIEKLDLAPDDPTNPRNWPEWKKWAIVIAIVPIDLSVSWAASGYSPASGKFAKDMGVSSEVGTLGLSMYVLGLALGPLLLAPLSEFFGRTPIYVYSYFIMLMFVLGTALAPNLGGFLVFRILSAMFASVTIANFGGTIADLWPTSKTGPAMSIFLWAGTGGSPTGYMLFSFVAGTRPWRDVFWALLGVNGGCWLVMTVVLFWIGETRHSVIARRNLDALKCLDKNLEKSAGGLTRSQRFRIAATALVQKALRRPFRFLFTEAIVLFGALYNGYLYGLSFLFNTAFKIVFAEKHGFTTIEVGLSFIGIIIGISLGPITNILQEAHYQRVLAANRGKNMPEGRVAAGKIAAFVFPISLFWFAWTTYASIHWIVPIIASTFWGWSFYTLILMTYTYTEDSYRTFSASALAGIGFARNLAGAGFPLFGVQMYTYKGFGGLEGHSTQIATTILACLAIALLPIPFILDRYGEALRKRSPWARMHMYDDAAEAVGEVHIPENASPTNTLMKERGIDDVV